ncbi:MAG: GDP-mannose 4,6-dehydratase [Candidatus Magasanikbacteria bacterium]|nr:GDP-mannose 4,6-dehydratase [Candidatus Magasanikbacteria bacterium]
MADKIALISGIAGQDGAYLADFLLRKNYRVIGLCRRATREALWRLDHFGIQNQVEILECDVRDYPRVEDILKKTQPHEYYNLAALSSVTGVWERPLEAFQTNCDAVVNMLESARRYSGETRIFQASSGKIYEQEKLETLRVTEDQSEFKPIDLYSVTKLAAHFSVINFREQYGLFAVNGILFQHESPLRPDTFVFKKIIKGVADLKKGNKKYLELGNLNVSRDWGFAGDYVRAMWMMLQAKKPEDFIISSGEQHTLRELLKVAFEALGIKDWEAYVRVNSDFIRKRDTSELGASNERIAVSLGWKPEYSFLSLIERMIAYEMEQRA